MQTHNDIDWSHRKGSSKGPDKWQYLCADFADCGGKMQSLINIERQKVINDKLLALPKFNYGAAKVDYVCQEPQGVCRCSVVNVYYIE